MSITFKAKDNITTSNPTNFAVTAEGLANSDASVIFDDIGTPKSKAVTVQPEYQNYTIKLSYTGNVEPNKSKEMKISVVSPIGKYYDHVRIVGEYSSPEDGTAKLIAIDENKVEYDILKDGWGDTTGYQIGGVVNQELITTGTFTEKGEYTIKLKLIDKENNDVVIAETTSKINVGEVTKVEEKEKLPTKLPKTGTDLYLMVLAIIGILAVCYIYIDKD